MISNTISTPSADDSSRHSGAVMNHWLPRRNTAPSTPPNSDPSPPTTAAVNTSRLAPAA